MHVGLIKVKVRAGSASRLTRTEESKLESFGLLVSDWMMTGLKVKTTVISFLQVVLPVITNTC